MRYLPALLLATSACGGSEPPVHPSIRPALERATGWTFKTDPVFERIDRARLAAHLESKMDARTAAAGRALRLLGVLPKDYDLVASVKRLYTEEILALYDLKERKVFLVRETFEKPPSAEDLQLRQAGRPDSRDLIVAHELVHALQHQNDPLLELLEDTTPDLDDVRTALHALAEGEATLHMYAPLGKVDRAAIQRGLQAERSGKLPGQPDFMRHLLVGPYVDGFQYADATGRPRRVPLSTEQLLDPRSSDPPVAVFLPDLSGAVGGGRRLAYETVLGQFHLPHVLAGLGLGSFAVRGWGGDRLQLYETASSADPVAVLLLHWDRAETATSLLALAKGKPGLVVAGEGKDVALVVGLGAADAVAADALKRRVAKPFSSVEELRALRAGFKP